MSSSGFDNIDIRKILYDAESFAHGSFGVMFGPFTLNSKKCAIKRISMPQCTLSPEMEWKIKSASLWTNLNHRNLIKVYHVRYVKSELYVIMEYASGGSLRTVLEKCSKDLAGDVIVDWAKQIANAMAYLHDIGLLHRDLKSDNIVMLEPFLHREFCQYALKITDYDSIKMMSEAGTVSAVGSFNWMAPEIIKQVASNLDKCTVLFSKACDVWSYGAVVWAIVSRQTPFANSPIADLVSRAGTELLEFPIPPGTPKVLDPILKGCFRYKKGERPKFREILKLLESTESTSSIETNVSDDDCPSEIGRLEDNLKKHQIFLVNRMDPNFGLLRILCANGTLPLEEIRKIELPIHTTDDRNKLLLDYIIKKQKAEQLIAALKEDLQHHLVNYLISDEKYKPIFGDNWPVDENVLDTLEYNQVQIVERLDTSELCIRLRSEKVLKRAQMDFIFSKPTEVERAATLIDILRHCSRQGHKILISCLHITKQHYLVEYFSADGKSPSSKMTSMLVTDGILDESNIVGHKNNGSLSNRDKESPTVIDRGRDTLQINALEQSLLQQNKNSAETDEVTKHRALDQYSKFIYGVNPDRLKDCLVKEDVISNDQWLQITNKCPTTQSKRRALLRHLFYSPHPKAYLVLCQAMDLESDSLTNTADTQPPVLSPGDEDTSGLTNDEIIGMFSKLMSIK